MSARHVELAYASGLRERYRVWAQKYTPLAGMAEVRTAAAGGPRLDLPSIFIPTEFEKLEEHGFGLQRKVKRMPVADLRQAVREYKRLVLLGEPGSGKTTTLWRLTYDLATRALTDPAAPLPLLAPLGGYTGPESMPAFLQGHFGALGPHLPAYLTQGRVVLLLDGIDEMPRRGRKERVGRIQGLLDVDRYDATPALVTCRALDYASGDAEALKLEKLAIKPLDPGQQRAYLHRYLGAAHGERLFQQLTGEAGDEIIKLWRVWQREGGTWEDFWARKAMPRAVSRRTNARQKQLWQELGDGALPLLALGPNPYMLLMLARVYAAGQGALPQNRGRLFAAFVDTLLAREERRTDRELWPGAQPLQTALAELAYAMQRASERGTWVERDWALRQLGEGCEPEQALFLAAGASLLELTGEQVRFIHQLIQEYFAALAWRTRWESGAPLAEQWPEGWLDLTGWEETALLLAGILPVAGPQGMASFVDDLLAVNPPLAARCLAESGQQPAHEKCAQRVQVQLVAITTGTGYTAQQRAVVGDALNYLGDPRPGVGLTKEGLPDIVWCAVPAGEFLMGNTKQTDAWMPSPSPSTR